jgi:hypothetical protein
METSPLMKTLNEAWQKQSQTIPGTVAQQMADRGLLNSTYTGQNMADALAQGYQANVLGRAPEVAALEGGWQESALERELRKLEFSQQMGLSEREFAADEQYRGWQRSMAERGFSADEAQRIWERGQTQSRDAFERDMAERGMERDEIADAWDRLTAQKSVTENTRRWEAEFGLSQRETSAQIARWAAENKAAGLDDTFMADQYYGMVENILNGSLTVDQAKAVILGSVGVQGGLTQQEADRLIQALVQFQTIRGRFPQPSGERNPSPRAGETR